MEDDEVKMVQRMFKGQRDIPLTFEQAKEMYKYEKLRDTPSFNLHDFSVWEGLDFEFVSFQKILTAEQFDFYKKDWEATIKFHEEQLVLQDKSNEIQLTVAKELLDYYLTVFFPRLEKPRFYLGIAVDKEKLTYLKAVYKKYLDDKKKSILVNHFRHAKTFQPIALELSLMMHQHNYILPDYQQFLAASDLPTKTVAGFLSDKLKWTDLTRLAEIEAIFNELNNFRKANSLKYLGELQGWHINIAKEPFSLMPVLLIDEDMYNS